MITMEQLKCRNSWCSSDNISREEVYVSLDGSPLHPKFISWPRFAVMLILLLVATGSVAEVVKDFNILNLIVGVICAALMGFIWLRGYRDSQNYHKISKLKLYHYTCLNCGSEWQGR